MKDCQTGDVNGCGVGGVDVMSLSLSRFSAPCPLRSRPLIASVPWCPFQFLLAAFLCVKKEQDYRGSGS